MVSESSQQRWQQTNLHRSLHARVQMTPERPTSTSVLSSFTVKKHRLQFEEEAFSSITPGVKQDVEPKPFLSQPYTTGEHWREKTGVVFPLVQQDVAHVPPSSAPQRSQRNFVSAPFLPTSPIAPEIFEQKVFAEQQMVRLKQDKVFFVENAPTLHQSLPTNTESQPAWHALTRLATTRHASVKLPTSQFPITSLRTAQHSAVKLVASQASMARLKTTQDTLTKLLTTQPSPARLKNLRSRRAALTGLGMAALLLLVLFAQTGLVKRTLSVIKTASFSSAPQLATSEFNPAAHSAADINASKTLVRLSQLDPHQYTSQAEFDTWAYSACSAASMTEVFNAYGRHYHIDDVLKVETAIGEITPQLGLLEDIGVARTAAHFGFTTAWGDDWTLKRVLNNANSGHPVIVGWPPDRYTDGHIVVVTGGDDDMVYLADSSLWNRHAISRTQFMQWWGGFAAVALPE